MFNIIHNVRVYRWIKRAKKCYYENRDILGMCRAFHITAPLLIQCVEDYIPEFNSHDLAHISNYGYWWDIDDRKSRIDAFNKLLEIYKKKIGFISRFV